MKRLLCIIIAFAFIIEVNAQQTSLFKDPRDGKVYKIVKIGDQWLMAENLAYKPSSGNYWAFNNDSSYVQKYGYLYDWETSQNIAPKGWHLPSEDEWLELYSFLNNSIEKSGLFEKYWQNTLTYFRMIFGGDSGFNAFLCGARTPDGIFKGSFVDFSVSTAFWGNTYNSNGKKKQFVFLMTSGYPIRGKEYEYTFRITEGYGASKKQGGLNEKFGLSVRLFLDKSEYNNIIIDRSNNNPTNADKKPTFNSITIGNQVWMAENLNVREFSNGDPIINLQERKDWARSNSGSYCYYYNDTLVASRYGALYNWHAVNDTRKLCPTGWHIPSEEDWNQLFDYLGGLLKAAEKITHYKYWLSRDSLALDTIGFNALPSSSRDLDGLFKGNFGISGYWWTSSLNEEGKPRALIISDINKISFTWLSKPWGLSVRCIKD